MFENVHNKTKKYNNIISNIAAIKPYMLGEIQCPSGLKTGSGVATRIVEIISHPFPELGETKILVRMDPLDPSTLESINVNDLLLPPKLPLKSTKIKYARIEHRFNFPSDMLRYNRCQICWHEMYRVKTKLGEKCIPYSEHNGPVNILAVYDRSFHHVWHNQRWMSFSANIFSRTS